LDPEEPIEYKMKRVADRVAELEEQLRQMAALKQQNAEEEELEYKRTTYTRVEEEPLPPRPRAYKSRTTKV
jgi:hypothetical protein